MGACAWRRPDRWAAPLYAARRPFGTTRRGEAAASFAYPADAGEGDDIIARVGDGRGGRRAAEVVARVRATAA